MGIMMRRACPARIITRMWKPLFLPLHAHVSLGLISLALCSRALRYFFSSVFLLFLASPMLAMRRAGARSLCAM